VGCLANVFIPSRPKLFERPKVRFEEERRDCAVNGASQLPPSAQVWAYSVSLREVASLGEMQICCEV
jgi:hypothetical protein